VTRHISKNVYESKIGQVSNPVSQNMRKVYENNIFVVNIPPEVDEVQLRKVFEEKPGDIISYKIKEILRKDKPEKSVI
jgi:hypothetical protein